MTNKGKKSLALQEKIEEHKAFLRHFQCLIGPEWLEQMGGVATIDRQLIMIDALVSTAQAELQQKYNANTLANYLYAVFTTVRDNCVTTSKRNIRTRNTLRPTKGVSEPPGLGEDVMRECAPAGHKFFTPAPETGDSPACHHGVSQFESVDTKLNACAGHLV